MGGTLLALAEPVGATYARLGAPYGVSASPEAILAGFRAAWRAWRGPRQIGDGRPFWREMVRASTGCGDPDYFEALYAHYARPDAWRVRDGARGALSGLQARGVRVAVVSNWDTRLRDTLDALSLPLDAMVISGEVGVEKPDPEIFRIAARRLDVPLERSVHLGDDPENDLAAARAVGCRALLWGRDLLSFRDLEGVLACS